MLQPKKSAYVANLGRAIHLEALVKNYKFTITGVIGQQAFKTDGVISPLI